MDYWHEDNWRAIPLTQAIIGVNRDNPLLDCRQISDKRQSTELERFLIFRFNPTTRGLYWLNMIFFKFMYTYNMRSFDVNTIRCIHILYRNWR